MLVKLTSSTAGEIIMFAEHARRLFEILGKERTARGVFTAGQLPASIAALRAAVDAEASQRRADEQRRADDRDEESVAEGDDDAADKKAAAVSLGQRAHPLIHLMERTLADDGFILWESRSDF